MRARAADAESGNVDPETQDRHPRPSSTVSDSWHVLCVDDDRLVHASTEFLLDRMEFLGRRVVLETAVSAAEALVRLKDGPEAAVILLDVVMERSDAGLRLVEQLREDLGNTATQIIIRTGQPGYAPERTVVDRFAINDYIDKSRSDDVRLLTAIKLAIRAYSQIVALRDAEARQSGELARRGAILKLIADPLLVVDADGRLDLASEAVREVLGYNPEELAGSPFLDLFSAEDRDSLSGAWSSARLPVRAPFRRDRVRVRAKDGSWRTMSVAGRSSDNTPGLAGAVFVLRDMTDLTLSEAEARRTQKLQAIGRLAGGIAHDFNNLLGAINGFATLVDMDASSGEDVRGFARRILDACERGRDLVGQILSFARAEDTVLEIIDLTEAVSGALDIVRTSLGSGVTFETSLIDDRVHVVGNRTQITQLLLNLSTNARDAVQRTRGRVEFSMVLGDASHWTKALPDGYVETRSGSIKRDTPYVFLTIRDNGTGIAPHALERLFEPFFTTKPSGRGTGLGLSVVHRIVRACRGALRVASREGHGSIVDVALPVVDGSGTAPSLRVDEGTVVDPGDINILVVDDDLDLAEGLSMILARRGYRVRHAQDPSEALAALTEGHELFDVVITDESMPGMLGTELIDRARQFDVPSEFIIYSGYGTALAGKRPADIGALRILRKPARLAEIEGAIRDAVVGRTGP